MNRKVLREWFKEHKGLVESVDSLRKELEKKDVPGLLRVVEMNGVVLEQVKLLLIAEIIRARGLLDQTEKG